MKTDPTRLILLVALVSGCLSSPLTLSEPVDALAGPVLSPPPSDAIVSPSSDSSPDTVPHTVACSPSPITIDRDCGTEEDETSCQVASGLAQTPCWFQDGWLVTICSQCWYLPLKKTTP